MQSNEKGLFHGYRVSFWGDENDLTLIIVIAAELCAYIKTD